MPYVLPNQSIKSNQRRREVEFRALHLSQRWRDDDDDSCQHHGDDDDMMTTTRDDEMTMTAGA
jgi:hypothetical protein